MLGAWQDKGPAADNLAFTMTNSQGLRGRNGSPCDAPGRHLRWCDIVATRPAFRLGDELYLYFSGHLPGEVQCDDRPHSRSD
jgi:hypothetical protein